MANNTCAQPPELYQGDGSTTKYSFSFPYIKTDDIAVFLWNDTTKEFDKCTLVDANACTGSPTEYYFENSTPVELTFCVAPPVPPADRLDDFSNIIIGREVDICQMVAYFYPGTSIRAQDLNNDFTQILLAIQDIQGGVYKELEEYNGFVRRSGDTMEGPLDMNDNRLTGVPDPNLGSDAVPLGFLEQYISGDTAAVRTTRYREVATQGQTIVNVSPSFAPGNELVFINGVELSRFNEYTTPTASQIVFNEPLHANDVIDVISYNNLLLVESSADFDAPPFSRNAFVATAGQTVFNCSQEYTVAKEQVFMNGALLERDVDYTAQDKVKVTLTMPALVGDIVEVHSGNYFATGIAPFDPNEANYTYPGGVEQTVQARLEQYVSVLDFGAKGDGVTDDYAAITQAITAAAGKVLIFPEGVYRTSQQIFFKESNSIIRGEGDVTIKSMDGIHGTIGCVGIGNPYTATEAYNGNWKNYPPTTNLILENIKIDYNRSRWFIDIPADAPTVAGRWVSCALSIANAQYITVRNCRVTDGKRQSIDITCPAGKYAYPDDSDDDRPGTLIEMINMPSQPVDVNGDAIFAARFITIDNCIAEGSGDDVIATHWCSNVLIKNSLFQMTSGKGQSSNTNCIEIDDGSRNITVDNCTAFNGMGGIEVKGHPPQPSPYNIIISNTRIINCADSFENHHTDWEERVDGKESNAWNQLLNTWTDVDGSSTQTVFAWTFPNDDLTGSSDIEVSFDDTSGTEVVQTSGFTIDFAGKTVTFALAPTSTRVRIRRKFFKLSPGTEFECYTYNGESPLARGLTYSNIQIIAPQQRYSINSSGKKNYLGVSRAFEIGAFNEVNLQNFYISDGSNDTGAGVDGYRPTQGQCSFRASDNSVYCRNHGYKIGEPVRFENILPADGSTGIVEDATNYWVKEVTGRNRFTITSEWEKVTDTRPEYDPDSAAVVPVNANGTAMLNVLGSGMFHIRDGVKSLSIDGVSIDGFGRIESPGGDPDVTYDPDRVMAVQAINIVSSTRGSLFVNNYRSNDGPIKVVDGTGSWQYTGHISNVYAFQSNGSTINQQPINSSNNNLAFSNITIAGYPEGRKWATNGPVTDVISERPTTAYTKSAGAGSLMTNKTTGQLLTKVTDQNDSNFLNLTACAWASVDMSVSLGTGKGFRRGNNFSSWSKTAAGTGTFYLSDNLRFASIDDVVMFVSSPAGFGYAGVPVLDADNRVSFEVTTTDNAGSSNNPQYLRILVFGRPL